MLPNFSNYFDKDLDYMLDLLDTMDDFSVLHDTLDKIDTFGIDLNFSLIKNEGEYECGLNIKSDNGVSEPVTIDSLVKGDSLIDIFDTLLAEVADGFNEANAKNAEKVVDNKTENVINSLKTDNALLERRVNELYKELEAERVKSRRAEEYNRTIEKWLKNTL